MRFNSPSTPTTGTINTSIFENFINEFLGSFIENFFLKIGSLYFTTLKLTPCINGTKTLLFFRKFGNNALKSTSFFNGKYTKML